MDAQTSSDRWHAQWEQTQKERAGDNGQNPTGQIVFPPLIPGDQIDRTQLVLPREIIARIVALSEKMELAGGSKSFKSWTFIDLALSVVNQSLFWGFETSKTPVVFLNMELQKPYFEHRLFQISDARRLPIPGNFHVMHLRGMKLHVLSRWNAFLKHLEEILQEIETPFIIADPIYKLLGGKNENSAGDINLMMDQLEDLIQLAKGSLLFGHHFAKGDSTLKEAIDRSAGSGVFQRDPDSILVVSPQEEQNCYTVESILRNHKPVEPFVIEWNFPCFSLRKELDPTQLRKKGSSAPRYCVEQLVDWLKKKGPLSTVKWQKLLHNETGMSSGKFYELKIKATEQKLVHFDVLSETWEVLLQ